MSAVASHQFFFLLPPLGNLLAIAAGGKGSERMSAHLRTAPHPLPFLPLVSLRSAAAPGK